MENVNLNPKFVINVFVLWHFPKFTTKMTHINNAILFFSAVFMQFSNESGMSMSSPARSGYIKRKTFLS